MGTVIVGVAGLLIGAAIGWVLAARRAPRHSSAVAPLVSVPGQGPPPEEIARMQRIAPLLARVDAAPIEHVVACGQASTVGEVAVELVLVELRGPGGQLLLRWRRLGIDPLRPPPLELDRHGRPKLFHAGQPVVALADDVGTAYDAMPMGASSSIGSGEAQVRFVPAVPPAARRLSVTVERFGGGRWRPPEAPKELVFEGPWHFEVPLDRE